MRLQAALAKGVPAVQPHKPAGSAGRRVRMGQEQCPESAQGGVSARGGPNVSGQTAPAAGPSPAARLLLKAHAAGVERALKGELLLLCIKPAGATCAEFEAEERFLFSHICC